MIAALLALLLVAPVPVATAPIDAYLRAHVDRLHLPGLAAAVVRDGKVEQVWTTGGLDRDTQVLIGSVSKPVTALAVQRLGIDLDTPAIRHLPWLDLAGDLERTVTVRQLLQHTSGLPQIATRGLTDRFDNTPDGLNRLVRDLREVEPAGPPGEHRYSDANYAILGALVAEVSNEPYAAALHRLVLDPLGMTGAGATADETAAVAPGHRMWLGRPRAFDPPYDTSGVPYGYLAATLDDLSRFALAQLGGSPVITPAMIDAAHTGGPGGYGLGWRETTSDDGERLVWHAGATPGFFSHIVLMPGRDTGVVVLTDAYHPGLDGALAAAAFGVATIAVGGTAEPIQGDNLFTYVVGALALIAALLILAAVRAGRSWLVVGVSALLVPGLLLVPRLWGAGLRQALLWTPDLAWSVIAVACLAALVAVAGPARRLVTRTR